jgi:hypothetical protein
VAARIAAAMLALLLGASCSKPQPPAPKPAVAARAEWRPECRPVKDDRHQACYGPGWEAQAPREPGKFHFYQVSVERTQPGESSTVLYVKRLATADVDARLLQEGFGGEVARYESASRSVRFDVGANAIVVPLADDPTPAKARKK